MRRAPLGRRGLACRAPRPQRRDRGVAASPASVVQLLRVQPHLDLGEKAPQRGGGSSPRQRDCHVAAGPTGGLEGRDCGDAGRLEKEVPRGQGRQRQAGRAESLLESMGQGRELSARQAEDAAMLEVRSRAVHGKLQGRGDPRRADAAADRGGGGDARGRRGGEIGAPQGAGEPCSPAVPEARALPEASRGLDSRERAALRRSGQGRIVLQVQVGDDDDDLGHGRYRTVE